MNEDYPSQIVQIVAKFDTRQPLPPLTPKEPWQSRLTTQLQDISPANLSGDRTLKDSSLGNTVKIGLLLWNDALDDAHRMVQEINTKTGDYWHAIMHRREPDYNNAKYWLGRVGNHPIFPTLRKHILDVLKEDLGKSSQLASYATKIAAKDNWDAGQFVDWCQSAAQDRNVEVMTFLQRAQVEEIKLLLDYSYRNALT